MSLALIDRSNEKAMLHTTDDTPQTDVSRDDRKSEAAAK